MTDKPVRIAAEALEELQAAARRCDEQHPGLGEEFLRVVRAAPGQLARSPRAAPAAAGIPKRLGARSLVVPGFPYVVIYTTRRDEARIFAFAHAARRPGYWRKRA